MNLRRPAAFFDRDGILNQDSGYVFRSEQFRWCEGAIEAIKSLNDRRYLVFVVTNQAGIAHGYYGEESVQALHRWMSAELAKEGAHIDGFYYCPHHPNGRRKEYAIDCDCRKPNPGMLLAAMREWEVDREHSFFIGDKESDLQAAKAASVHGILWRKGDVRDAVNEAIRATVHGK